MIFLKGFKGFIILLIIIFTTAGILYLVYQAKRLERYTSVSVDEETHFLIYSSKSAITQDGKDIGELLKYIRNELKDLGYGTSIIEYKDKEDFISEAKAKINGDSKYILIDVGLSSLVINKNTVLIRTELNSSDKSKENIELANSIKNKLKNENIKVNVLQDSKNDWNGEIGSKSLRIEISDKCTLGEAEKLLSTIVNINH